MLSLTIDKVDSQEAVISTLRHTHTTLDRDRHVIRAVVRRFGPISRAQICQMTDLRRSTTSLLVRELIAEGQLVECGRSDNAMGRKQVLLNVNQEFRYIAGIDFDDETVSAGIMDLSPRIRATVSESTRLEGGREALLRQLISCARQAIAKAKLKPC